MTFLNEMQNVVLDALAEDGVAGKLRDPGQAGPGDGLSGGRPAQEWDVVAILLPASTTANRDSVVTTDDASAVLGPAVRPRRGYELRLDNSDDGLWRITSVDTYHVGAGVAGYLCGLKGNDDA